MSVLQSATKAKDDLRVFIKGLEFVSEYLTTHELFNLVFTSKLFIDALKITVIIKNVMMSGN